MYAYNPKTQQTIEITEQGFSIIETKGWTRAVNQNPVTVEAVPIQEQKQAPLVDIKAEMEKRKQEIAEQKIAGDVTLLDIPAKAPVEMLPHAEPLDNVELHKEVKTKKPKAALGKASSKIKTKK
jgi:hypothetical protein